MTTTKFHTTDEPNTPFLINNNRCCRFSREKWIFEPKTLTFRIKTYQRNRWRRFISRLNLIFTYKSRDHVINYKASYRLYITIYRVFSHDVTAAILVSKTIKRRPCWCPKPILWELNSFLMQTISFVPIHLHRCWPRK